MLNKDNLKKVSKAGVEIAKDESRSFLLDLLTGVIVKVVLILVAVGVGLYYISGAFNFIGNKVDEVSENTSEFVSKNVQAVSNAKDTAVKTVVDVKNKTVKTIVTTKDEALMAVSTTKDEALMAASTTKDNVINKTKKVATDTAATVKNMVNFSDEEKSDEELSETIEKELDEIQDKSEKKSFFDGAKKFVSDKSNALKDKTVKFKDSLIKDDNSLNSTPK